MGDSESMSIILGPSGYDIQSMWTHSAFLYLEGHEHCPLNSVIAMIP